MSLIGSATLVDGGDHVTAVMTLILLPLALTDSRVWHWERSSATGPGGLGLRERLRRLVGLSAVVVARVRVAVIYFQSSVGKMGVEEWGDGTALYYWLNHPTFGAAEWLRPALMPLLSSAVALPLLTWGVIAVELVLAVGLVLQRKWWSYLLIVGLTFHFMIALVQGLVSFSIAMTAALVLYLRPVEQPLDVAGRLDRLTAGARRHLGRLNRTATAG